MYVLFLIKMPEVNWFSYFVFRDQLHQRWSVRHDRMDRGSCYRTVTWLCPGWLPWRKCARISPPITPTQTSGSGSPVIHLIRFVDFLKNFSPIVYFKSKYFILDDLFLNSNFQNSTSTYSVLIRYHFGCGKLFCLESSEYSCNVELIGHHFVFWIIFSMENSEFLF